MTSPDWSMPEAWLAEDTAMRKVAAELRAEAALMRGEYYRARKEGRIGDAAALSVSFWSVTGKASEIERHLRGVA